MNRRRNRAGQSTPLPRQIEEMGIEELRRFVARPPRMISSGRIWAALTRLRRLERLERFDVRSARMARFGRATAPGGVRNG